MASGWFNVVCKQINSQFQTDNFAKIQSGVNKAIKGISFLALFIIPNLQSDQGYRWLLLASHSTWTHATWELHFFPLMAAANFVKQFPPPIRANKGRYDISHNEQSIHKLRWNDEQLVLYNIEKWAWWGLTTC